MLDQGLRRKWLPTADSRIVYALAFHRRICQDCGASLTARCTSGSLRWPHAIRPRYRMGSGRHCRSSYCETQLWRVPEQAVSFVGRRAHAPEGQCRCRERRNLQRPIFFSVAPAQRVGLQLRAVMARQEPRAPSYADRWPSSRGLNSPTLTQQRAEIFATN
jgi:hypothetical protein